MLGNGYISPVVPWGDAQLLAQLIDTIDGTTTVTTCYDNLIVDSGDDELLAFAFQVSEF